MTDAQRDFDARRKIERSRQRERATKRKRVSPEFIAKVQSEARCRNCGRGRRSCKIDAHHIVHRGKMGRDHPMRDHPDNAMALCHECHMGHHDGTVKIHRGALTASEIAFIIRYMSEGYLDRQYPEER